MMYGIIEGISTAVKNKMSTLSSVFVGKPLSETSPYPHLSEKKRRGCPMRLPPLITHSSDTPGKNSAGQHLSSKTRCASVSSLTNGAHSRSSRLNYVGPIGNGSAPRSLRNTARVTNSNNNTDGSRTKAPHLNSRTAASNSSPTLSRRLHSRSRPSNVSPSRSLSFSKNSRVSADAQSKSIRRSRQSIALSGDGLNTLNSCSGDVSMLNSPSKLHSVSNYVDCLGSESGNTEMNNLSDDAVRLVFGDSPGSKSSSLSARRHENIIEDLNVNISSTFNVPRALSPEIDNILINRIDMDMVNSDLKIENSNMSGDVDCNSLSIVEEFSIPSHSRNISQLINISDYDHSFLNAADIIIVQLKRLKYVSMSSMLDRLMLMEACLQWHHMKLEWVDVREIFIKNDNIASIVIVLEKIQILYENIIPTVLDWSRVDIRRLGSLSLFFGISSEISQSVDRWFMCLLIFTDQVKDLHAAKYSILSSGATLPYLNITRDLVYCLCESMMAMLETTIREDVDVGVDPEVFQNCRELLKLTYSIAEIELVESNNSDYINAHNLVMKLSSEIPADSRISARRLGVVGLYCYCFHLGSENMLQCEECKDWFHMECLGYDVPTRDRRVKFRCRDCKIDSQITEAISKLEVVLKTEHERIHKVELVDKRLMNAEKTREKLRLKLVSGCRFFPKEYLGDYPIRSLVIEKNDKGEQLFCLCRKPYKKNESMIECLFCKEWYHLSCEGLSKSSVSSVPKNMHYMCLACNEVKHQQLHMSDDEVRKTREDQIALRTMSLEERKRLREERLEIEKLEKERIRQERASEKIVMRRELNLMKIEDLAMRKIRGVFRRQERLKQKSKGLTRERLSALKADKRTLRLVYPSLDEDIFINCCVAPLSKDKEDEYDACTDVVETMLLLAQSYPALKVPAEGAHSARLSYDFDSLEFNLKWFNRIVREDRLYALDYASQIHSIVYQQMKYVFQRRETVQSSSLCVNDDPSSIVHDNLPPDIEINCDRKFLLTVADMRKSLVGQHSYLKSSGRVGNKRDSSYLSNRRQRFSAVLQQCAVPVVTYECISDSVVETATVLITSQTPVKLPCRKETEKTILLRCRGAVMFNPFSYDNSDDDDDCCVLTMIARSKRRAGLFQNPCGAPSPCLFALVKHILYQSYTRAIDDPRELNKYVGFTGEVYGEARPELVNELIDVVPILPNHWFLDLGSGVGNVVLQVAAQVHCEFAFGVELRPAVAAYANQMAEEFRNRMRIYNKVSGNFKLVEGNFLDETVVPKDMLARADVVLCNNLAFEPSLNDKLLSRLLDMKDGSKIVSLVPFSGRRLKRDASSAMVPKEPNSVFTNQRQNKIEDHESGDDSISDEDRNVESVEEEEVQCHSFVLRRLGNTVVTCREDVSNYVGSTPSWFVSCPCGVNEQDFDDHEPMVQCELCSIWQHIKCVVDNEDIIPEIFTCSSCWSVADKSGCGLWTDGLGREWGPAVILEVRGPFVCKSSNAVSWTSSNICYYVHTIRRSKWIESNGSERNELLETSVVADIDVGTRKIIPIEKKLRGRPKTKVEVEKKQRGHLKTIVEGEKKPRGRPRAIVDISPASTILFKKDQLTNLDKNKGGGPVPAVRSRGRPPKLFKKE